MPLYKQTTDHRFLPSKPFLPAFDSPWWMPEQVGRAAALSSSVQKHSNNKIQPQFQKCSLLQSRPNSLPAKPWPAAPLFTAHRKVMPFHRNLLVQEASLRGNNHFSNSTYICKVVQRFSATPSWAKPTDWRYTHPELLRVHMLVTEAFPLPILCNSEVNLWK